MRLLDRLARRLGYVPAPLLRPVVQGPQWFSGPHHPLAARVGDYWGDTTRGCTWVKTSPTDWHKITSA